MGVRPLCPAVADVVGAPAGPLPSVVCGVLKVANRGATLDGFSARGFISPVQDGQRDAKTVASLCSETGDVPAITADEAESGGHAHYTACPLWRAAREADWAGRKGSERLRDRAHRRAVLPRELPADQRAGLDALRARP